MNDNLSLARTLYEGWNEHRFDDIADAMAPDGKIIVAGTGDEFAGPEGARQYNQQWYDAFPDGHLTVNNVVGSGDTVVVEFTGQGTHTGPLVTSMGDIPATGRSVTLNVCEVLEFRDGKITAQRSYLDTGSLMAQLGLLPEQSATVQQ